MDRQYRVFFPSFLFQRRIPPVRFPMQQLAGSSPSRDIPGWRTQDCHGEDFSVQAETRAESQSCAMLNVGNCSLRMESHCRSIQRTLSCQWLQWKENGTGNSSPEGWSTQTQLMLFISRFCSEVCLEPKTLLQTLVAADFKSWFDWIDENFRGSLRARGTLANYWRILKMLYFQENKKEMEVDMQKDCQSE